MNLKRLIFQDKISIKTDYKTFCNSRSFKTNSNFIKSRQDDKVTSAYFKSRRFGIPMTRVTITQNFQDRDVIIKHKLVNIIPLIYGLCIASLWVSYLLDIDGLRQRDGLGIPILVTGLFYGFLQYIYYTELLDIRINLKYIEVETKDTKRTLTPGLFNGGRHGRP